MLGLIMGNQLLFKVILSLLASPKIAVKMNYLHEKQKICIS